MMSVGLKKKLYVKAKSLSALLNTLMEENKKLKGNVNKNQTALLEQAKKECRD
jgi:hypothetical protein